MNKQSLLHGDKVLVICGPTATGKTALALQISREFNGELISADSRQVYRGMDIVTNKGLLGGERAHLTDLVDPSEEFNVSQWRKNVKNILLNLSKDGKLPIIVGGTGLYIESLIKNIDSIDIPPNKQIRQQLKDKTVDDLYETLASVDAIRAASLNQSDRKNPRRLLRAIEVGLVKNNDKKEKTDDSYNFLLIGLTGPKEVLFEKIKQSILERVKNGALEEVSCLLEQGVHWEAQSMTGIGYRELKPFFEKKQSLDTCVEKWIRAEQKYALRQRTWFKRYEKLKWFDITDTFWQDDVAKAVRAWYNQG